MTRTRTSPLAPAPQVAPVDRASGDDPELLALPAPPRRERTAALVVMAITSLAALGMCAALAGEAIYALSPGRPQEVADLAALAAGPALANRYVRGQALLGTSGAVRYGRLATWEVSEVPGADSGWVAALEGGKSPGCV